jgi:hypothetical protein
MFEHMRNYDTLLARVASWMAPAATLFQRDVRILEHWQVPGWHYQLTSASGRNHARAGPHGLRGAVGIR